MNPTVFREAKLRFHFFSREETRMHVHVTSPDGEAKFWLEPVVELAQSYRFSQAQIKQIQSTIEANYGELCAAWRRHFGT
ncbi:hypothetical protein CKO31_05915 [Thiohalocapsa halophila]|uniref:DUF4160 domain-containing protein n=1 Tax=Thiohalocapsa halophila TaxID=69359 RepID=A0ABS1CEH8_9GAMM|nr:DUF4160 domain-containing protein [Thiohalocapsa halophila]MBK1630290.1 hypothetical protein [Thiohalocapsa halophila]